MEVLQGDVELLTNNTAPPNTISLTHYKHDILGWDLHPTIGLWIFFRNSFSNPLPFSIGNLFLINIEGKSLN